MTVLLWANLDFLEAGRIAQGPIWHLPRSHSMEAPVFTWSPGPPGEEKEGISGETHLGGGALQGLFSTFPFVLGRVIQDALLPVISALSASAAPGRGHSGLSRGPDFWPVFSHFSPPRSPLESPLNGVSSFLPWGNCSQSGLAPSYLLSAA